MFSRNLPYWGTIYIPYSDSLYLLRLRGVNKKIIIRKKILSVKIHFFNFV